jgi:uncharacterized protein (DUF58 family)
MPVLPDPKFILSIKNLSLAARYMVDPFLSGINKSRVKGQGQEFSQYRSYQPGDDLRWMDWKMYARSDRYYVRESEMDTSIHVRIMLDASNSMNHTDDGFSKMDYARLLAASLGYLAYRQGDAIGLFVFREGNIFSIPSRNDSKHLSRFFYQLENIQPAGSFTEAVHFRQLLSGMPRKELVIFITDFYEENGEIMQLLQELAACRHEIVVFQVMGKNEMEMNFKGFATLEDLETGERIVNAGADLQEAAKENMQQYLAGIKKALHQKNISYRLLQMDQPLNEAIMDFLRQRQKSFV